MQENDEFDSSQIDTDVGDLADDMSEITDYQADLSDDQSEVSYYIAQVAELLDDSYSDDEMETDSQSKNGHQRLNTLQEHNLEVIRGVMTLFKLDISKCNSFDDTLQVLMDQKKKLRFRIFKAYVRRKLEIESGWTKRSIPWKLLTDQKLINWQLTDILTGSKDKYKPVNYMINQMKDMDFSGFQIHD